MDLEQTVHTYLSEMSRFIRTNSLLISAPKSSETLFTPDTAHANTRQKIKVTDSKPPLVRSPKILGMHLDTFFSFLQSLRTSGQQSHQKKQPLEGIWQAQIGDSKRRTLLMTYKSLGRSIAKYAVRAID